MGAGTAAPPRAPARTLGPGLGVHRSPRQHPACLHRSAGRPGDNATGDSGGSAREVPAGDRAPGTAPPVGTGRQGGGGSRVGLGAERGRWRQPRARAWTYSAPRRVAPPGNCAQTQVSALEGAWGRGLPAPAPASCGAFGRLVGGHAAALRAGARRWCLACAHLGRRLETWRGHAVCRGSVRPWALGAGAAVIPFCVAGAAARGCGRWRSVASRVCLRASGAKRGCSASQASGSASSPRFRELTVVLLHSLIHLPGQNLFVQDW